MICIALYYSKKLFAAEITIPRKCIHCSYLEESVKHAFFNCVLVWLLYKMLNSSWFACYKGMFFVFEDISISSNMVLPLDIKIPNDCLWLHKIMIVMTWMTRLKGFFETNFFLFIFWSLSLGISLNLSLKLWDGFCIRRSKEADLIFFFLRKLQVALRILRFRKDKPTYPR